MTKNLKVERHLLRPEADGHQMILTPNHFWFGHLGGAITIERIGQIERLWKVVHKLLLFWERKAFLKDHVSELKQTRKWKSIKSNVQVGDLVFKVDPNEPQGTWKDRTHLTSLYFHGRTSLQSQN